MKTFYILTCVLTLSFGAKAQWVSIPDPNFVDYLQTFYPGCMNGSLMDTTCSEILNTTNLEILYDISNLWGIQFFDNLDTLYCSNIQLSSLPSLPMSLKALYCYENLLTSLPVLPASLTKLVCHNNQLTSLPGLPASLKILRCANNQLFAMPSLPSSLIYIDCSFNQLTNLSNLPSSLTEINCSSNQLTSLPSLPPSLMYLICSNNQINSLPVLPMNLTYLDCSFNQLSNLPILPQSMFALIVNNNTQLPCLPPIYQITCDDTYGFDISNTSIECLPNMISHGFASWPAIDTMPICNVINSNNCSIGWNMQGTVSYDIDNNCTTTDGNIGLHQIKVKLLDGANNLLQQVYSNSNSQYSFNDELGSYKIQIDTTGLPYTILCPLNNNVNVTLNASNPISQNNNFQIVCKPGFDVGVTSVNRINGWIFPGQQSTIRVKAGDIANVLNNITCNTNSLQGQVKVKINGPVSYAGAASGALTPLINNETLIYNVSDFSLINPSTSFVFKLLTDSTAQALDQVCIEVSVTPTQEDNNVSNNYLIQCFNVVNSYDPNVKEVSPKQIQQLGEWLTYTIHFQNTGNAPAFNIKIIDTLSSDLDWESFQLLDYSHEVFAQMHNNGIIHFNFLNIMLPDSASDPEGSKGYVQFKIKTIDVLYLTITNNASIYFDFNAPIKTNDAVVSTQLGTNKVNTTSVFTIYPNPAQTEVNINTLYTNYTIRVLDIHGRVITTQQLAHANTKLSTASFAPGIYFIELLNEKVVERKKLVIAK